MLQVVLVVPLPRVGHSPGMKFAYFHRFQGISVVSKHLFRAIVGDDDFLVLIMDQACDQPPIKQLPERVITFSESRPADIGF